MRVAIYVHDMRASGVVRAMIGLARCLAAQGDDAILVAGSSAGPLGADDVAPARFAAASRSPVSQIAVVPALRRTLRDIAPDVVLSGGNHGHMSVWAATRGTGLPLVLTFSNPMTRPDPQRRNAWRRVKSAMLLRAAAQSIVVGANVAADPAFAPAVAHGRAVLVPNGIDVAGARAKAHAGPPPFVDDGVPVVLAIGRLHHQKNFEGLIDAVAVASTARPLRLVILGDGPDAYRAELLARAARHGIAGRVTFAGVTDNVFPWLRAARVFALASLWEGSSIALLEALAAETPIVASLAAGDAAEVLDRGRFGRLADAGDPAAFAAALIAQIDDPVRPGDRADLYDSAAMFAAYRTVLAGVARPTPANAPQPVNSSATTLPPSVAQAPPITP